MAERLSEGVVVLVIGMAIVFGVLILLWAILLGFEKVFYKIPQKRKAKEAAKPQVVTEAKEAAPQVEEDESEIVAVITAAICAMTNQSATNFKIKSIKRISNWNK